MTVVASPVCAAGGTRELTQGRPSASLRGRSARTDDGVPDRVLPVTGRVNGEVHVTHTPNAEPGSTF